MNKEGKYDLFLCRGGLWRSVTLDDYLPITQSGQEMFARANDSELWVLLLEKAFAKISGNYQMLSQGQEHEAFMDLTGAEKAEPNNVCKFVMKCPNFKFCFRCACASDSKGR